MEPIQFEKLNWPWWSDWLHRRRLRKDVLGYMQVLAAKQDPVYKAALRESFNEVLGEDPY